MNACTYGWYVKPGLTSIGPINCTFKAEAIVVALVFASCTALCKACDCRFANVVFENVKVTLCIWFTPAFTTASIVTPIFVKLLVDTSILFHIW